MDKRLLLKPIALTRAATHRVARHFALNKIIKAGRQRLQNSPAYRPDLVPAGFAPHRGDEKDDSELLERICSAYTKAKEVQRGASETYNVSNEWLPIYRQQLGPVMHALESHNIKALRAMYQNFYRDPCSTGLAGLPANMRRCYFGSVIKNRYRHLFLTDVVHRYELWKQETGHQFTTQVLTSPDIGNPYGYFVDNLFIKGGSDYQHFYATKIAALLKDANSQTVVELGGGFGGMAYYLIRDNPRVTYVDLDLPENTALASYYLLKAFPRLPTLLYGEANLSSETLSAYRIVLMPSFEIQKLLRKSVAVSFNSYSLAEMSRSTIDEYIGHITRITNGYFLQINHTRNAVVTADNFGIEKYGFRLLERKVAGWTLGLNPKADEYEFLYQA